ncbi:hypothetical protein K439DRAFT_757703 [Ramaria rubella]|nr:hypothetical protein K439DRAFT_757703 [Ramaria rubella]
MDIDTPSTAGLPQELVDHVIDHLWDDLPSLQAASLTCWSWVEPAQYHIFHHVEARVTSAEPFWMLLKSSPYIGKHVKSLAIYQIPNISSISLFPDEVDGVVHPLLPGAASVLRRVENLQISHIFFSRLGATAHKTLLQSCAFIRTLSISHAVFQNLDQLVDILVSHPHIESLDISDVSFTDSEHETDLTTTPRITYSSSLPQLRNLAICGRGSEPLMEWLLSRDITLLLASLKVASIQKEGTPLVTQFLTKVCPPLRRLEIGLSTGWLREDDVLHLQTLSMSENTSLRTLVLQFQRCNPYYRSVPSRIFTKWLPAVLSRTSFVDLQEIICKVLDLPPRYTTPHRLPVELQRSDLPWGDRMDKLLTGAELRSLRRVTFWFCGHDVVSFRIKERVAHSFPRLHSMGRLYFGGPNDPLKSSLELDISHSAPPCISSAHAVSLLEPSA